MFIMFYFSCLIRFIYIYLCVCVVSRFYISWLFAVHLFDRLKLDMLAVRPNLQFWVMHAIFSSGDVGDDLVSQHEIPIGVINPHVIGLPLIHWPIDPMDRSSGMHGIVPIVDMVVSRLSACRKQQENACWHGWWRKTYGKIRKTSLNLRDKTFNKNTVSHRSSRIVPKPNDSKNWPSLSSSMRTVHGTLVHLFGFRSAIPACAKHVSWRCSTDLPACTADAHGWSRSCWWISMNRAGKSSELTWTYIYIYCIL